MADTSDSSTVVNELKWHQRCVLTLLSGALWLWMRTLRFDLSELAREFKDQEPKSCILIAWHNRIFPLVEFIRRYLGHRQISAVVSASGDGAWIAELLVRLGLDTVRGSRSRRGAQSLRDMIKAVRSGRDIAITPDGSKGPMYEMKPGAVAVAVKTGVPIVLLSFNFGRAWRLKSWDRFYLPCPFSRLRVRCHFPDMEALAACPDTEARAAVLKEQMDAITEDALVRPSARA